MPNEKLYSLDVAIYATAYVKASSEEEAKKKVTELCPDSLFVEGDMIDGRVYQSLMDDDGADVTLSPAMTIDHIANDYVDMVFDPEDPDAG